MRRRPLVRMLALGLVSGASACTDWDRLSRDYAERPSCATFVVAGDTHSCARTSTGALYCWGDNRFGQLGTGDTRNRPVPTAITVGPGLGTLRVYLPTGNGDITADLGASTCVIASDDALWCWGDNRFGQLGTGNAESTNRAVRIAGLPGSPSKVTLGAGHTCVMTTDGALSCFGRNVQGQLGVGDTTQRNQPVPVDLGRPVERLAAGGDFTCARGTDAILFCWGTNGAGQLGVGTTDASPRPVEVKALANRVGRLATGAAHACVFTEDDGRVRCWGDNRSGQLGTGDTQRRLEPVEVDPGNLGAVRTNTVFAGGNHSCALRDDNTLWCWGGNRFGQLGTGDTQPRPTPVKVLDEVSAAYTGGAHTCALGLDGSVRCWGNNQYGQVGADVGTQSVSPVTVLGACLARPPKLDQSSTEKPASSVAL